jgi:hypothetical protein
MRPIRRILPVLLLVHVLFGTAATAQSTLSFSSYLGSGDETVMTIPAGGAGSVVSSGLASQVRAGYASASTNGDPTPYGAAVLSLMENGVTVSEVGVPASGLMTAARLFIDFRKNVSAGSSGPVNVNTGIMMVNPGSAPATISLRLLSVSGQVIASGPGSLNGGSHLSYSSMKCKPLRRTLRCRAAAYCPSAGRNAHDNHTRCRSLAGAIDSDPRCPAVRRWRRFHEFTDSVEYFRVQ